MPAPCDGCSAGAVSGGGAGAQPIQPCREAGSSGRGARSLRKAALGEPAVFACSQMCSAAQNAGPFQKPVCRSLWLQCLENHFVNDTFIASLCAYKIDTKGIKALIGNWPVGN